MRYKIDQIIMLELEEGLGIQNSTGLTIITDNRLKNFFDKIDRDNRLEVDFSFFENNFGNESKKVIDYLTDAKILYKENEKNNFEQLNLFSNNKTIFESFKFNKVGIQKETTEIFYKNNEGLISDIETKSFESSSLNIFVLVPFDYIDFIKINSIMRRKNVMHNFVFAYNSKLYITNIHKKDWYNPCAKCFFSHLEASLRAYENNTSETTFQTIVDLLYSKKIMFNPDLPLNHWNVIDCIRMILQLNHDEDINLLANRIVLTSLKNEITYDQALHWELCDCFE
ncbi:MAG: McbB family protein [Streptococcaceae bacterium]|jgi:McbB family protein|nr:McbB family protein [Streptococcaceae bacterium]